MNRGPASTLEQPTLFAASASDVLQAPRPGLRSRHPFIVPAIPQMGCAVCGRSIDMHEDPRA